MGNNTVSIPSVSEEAIINYEEHIDSLVGYVNETITNDSIFFNLIGRNNLEKMYDNHENHAKFMVNAFRINDYDFVYRVVVWVYNSYHKHGFSYEYFLVELKIWRNAINKYLEPNHAASIIRVYDWLIEHHNDFLEASKDLEAHDITIPEDFKEEYPLLIDALIKGNYTRCLELVKTKINLDSDIKKFYQSIIHPAMYEIGLLWQKNMISVAQEHLASAMVQRLISEIYLKNNRTSNENKYGQGVITAIANEYHEIGTRMVADVLELEGWDIKHLGADTPIEALVGFLKSEQPYFVGISATMAFNVNSVKKVINRIRSIEGLKEMKILVGGKVFNENPDLWKIVDADAWGKDIQNTVDIVKEWWDER
ncbi:MAG TPA: cobalamin-dependent protein [Clostridia bacterium]|nr:cobalamin-dependent protein [Clostridia bacterium]